ncbi:MAG: hypothetical protein JSV77_01380 [Dehalococcoidales bacterium]|nr:MAG: hypothetical protein JSV77_01380 [Dehalococcoidales bacterium]
MLQRIVAELRHHIPFTILGAVISIVAVVIIVATGALPSVSGVSETVFYVLHPLHVVLSAGVTTAMYRKYTRGRLLPAILVGYLGSIGVATLSDSVVPFIGETLLNLPQVEAHIGFIEEWQIVNPAALLGVAIGLWNSHTLFPHAGHVFLSTWASLFHIIMALGETVEWIQFLPIFVFLFLAVWLPCCLSDIVFPLLFTKGNIPIEEG